MDNLKVICCPLTRRGARMGGCGAATKSSDCEMLLTVIVVAWRAPPGPRVQVSASDAGVVFTTIVVVAWCAPPRPLCICALLLRDAWTQGQRRVNRVAYTRRPQVEGLDVQEALAQQAGPLTCHDLLLNCC